MHKRFTGILLGRRPEQSQCCQSTMNGPWAPVSCWASSNAISEVGFFKHVKQALRLFCCIGREGKCLLFSTWFCSCWLSTTNPQSFTFETSRRTSGAERGRADDGWQGEKKKPQNKSGQRRRHSHNGRVFRRGRWAGVRASGGAGWGQASPIDPGHDEAGAAARETAQMVIGKKAQENVFRFSAEQLYKKPAAQRSSSAPSVRMRSRSVIGRMPVSVATLRMARR